MSFFVIKVVNKDREKGYVIDRPDGISIITNGFTDITQFKTWKEAYRFIRDKKLEKNGIKAYIISNQDLMEEEKNNSQIKVVNKIMYYLEDFTGRKLFYSTHDEDYYFDNRENGYCVFETEEQINRFIKQMIFPFKVEIKKIFPKS